VSISVILAVVAVVNAVIASILVWVVIQIVDLDRRIRRMSQDCTTRRINSWWDR